jgi:mannose-6-phosphate isomerase-like protein (cupin superfamily)
VGRRRRAWRSSTVGGRPHPTWRGSPRRPTGCSPSKGTGPPVENCGTEETLIGEIPCLRHERRRCRLSGRPRCSLIRRMVHASVWPQAYQGSWRKERSIVATDGKAVVVLAEEAETVSLPGNRISFVHREPDSAYSLVEWVAEPRAPGTPLHIHEVTDEGFYVLEGSFGFQVGEETIEAAVGGFRLRAQGGRARVLEPGPLVGQDAHHDVPARLRAVLRRTSRRARKRGRLRGGSRGGPEGALRKARYRGRGAASASRGLSRQRSCA